MELAPTSGLWSSKRSTVERAAPGREVIHRLSRSSYPQDIHN